MEKVEKILLVAVLGVALLIVGVMAALPPDVGSGIGTSSDLTGVDPTGSQATAMRERAEDGGRGLSSNAIFDSMRDRDRERSKEYEPIDLNAESQVAASHGASPASSGGENRAPGLESSAQRDARAEDPELGTGRGSGMAGMGGTGGTVPSERELAAGSNANADASGALASAGAKIAYREFASHPVYSDYYVYRVQRDDTLSQIAADYCVGGAAAIEAIVKVNEKLAIDPRDLSAGEDIIIPKAIVLPAEERHKRELERAQKARSASRPIAKDLPRGSADYVVMKGENLWTIAVARVGARRANAYIEQIRSLNPQIRGDLVRGGDHITLPEVATSGSAAKN
ncbi:MAG: LysM peptidoglycan-binding domain-containing protein [Planctomycetes bacterium]|nr:LysM peptidoglycan-binding domain-containing protein [Planctomycetota bacterium]MCB9918341.1 LysM peptidoglycan-binding domain-containing protein [Planctomycetota bacterium]